jgi:hypothetical protein
MTRRPRAAMCVAVVIAAVLVLAAIEPRLDAQAPAAATPRRL